MTTIPTGPEIDHSRIYTSRERLTLALSQYYSELQLHAQNQTVAKKPIVLQISKLYSVSESSLRRHICTPNQRTVAEVQASCQILSSAEEGVLVERLLFLDDFNVPASKAMLYEMVESLLQK